MTPGILSPRPSVTLSSSEVAQARYKLWKIQQRATGDTVLYNQARHILQLLSKAERRASKGTRRGHNVPQP